MDDWSSSSIVEVVRTTARVGDDDNDDEEEEETVAMPRRSIVFVDWLRRDNIDLSSSLNVASGGVVVVDDVADRSDAVDDAVEPLTYCWYLVVGACCCCCCCNLIARSAFLCSAREMTKPAA